MLCSSCLNYVAGDLFLNLWLTEQNNPQKKSNFLQRRGIHLQYSWEQINQYGQSIDDSETIRFRKLKLA
ncbi:hypothetical protein CMV_024617 [Castanea mollissima]|uniref:Uncharacterized protein n=1 Tax=Castanea mollissima TaxID=60419 RepID=A0A8J4QGK2_9ROSI|nr:hypothetical protein CMV_024617 [Castanea mollissima]